MLYIGAQGERPPNRKVISPEQYMALRQRSINQHGRWLSDTLLRPLARQIDSASQWIIAADGVLANLPWDTLPWHGKPLGQQKQLTVVQSLAAYKSLENQ
jgi:hypothetical protein